MRKLWVLIVLFTLFLVGCNGSSSGGGEISKQVTNISISPINSIITKGLTQQYTAIAIYSDGSSSELTSGVTWTSSDTNIATINSNGLAKVIAESGTTNISASYNGINSQTVAKLTATTSAITAVSVSPIDSIITKGLTQQYTATAIYSDGNSSELTTGVNWVSSDTNIATITSDGLATVVASLGTTDILATYNGVTNDTPVKLTATAAKVTAISISPIDSTIIKDLTQQYTATAKYSDGSSSELTTGVNWQSSNLAVAEIDDNGLARVISSSGSTDISATYNGVISQTPALLSATDAVVTELMLSPSESTIANGSTQQYTALAKYSDGEYSIVNTGLNWSSSDNNIATITDTGLATAIKGDGSTNITASYNGINSPAVILNTTVAWVDVGSIQTSIAHMTSAMSINGTPYIAYIDMTLGKKVSVKQFDGNEWIYSGSPAFSESITTNTSGRSSNMIHIATNSLNLPCISYATYATGDQITVNCINKDTKDWRTMSANPINTGTTGYIQSSLGISKTNQIYVAYRDGYNGNKVSVVVNNALFWSPVGVSGFSESILTERANTLDMKIAPDGTPYVAYVSSKTTKLSVMKFDGAKWVYVGESSFSPGLNHMISLAIAPDNTPYVSFIAYDIVYLHIPQVMKFNGSKWEYVGESGGVNTKTKISADDDVIAIAPDGTPYIAFTDKYKIPFGTSVMKFNGSEWEYVGNKLFGTNNPYFLNILIDPITSTPYVSNMDGVLTGNGTVMRFD